MRRKLVVFLLIFSLSLGFFACLFPYPIFSRYTNITESNMYDITNYQETELSTQKANEIKVINLDWEYVDSLLEIGKEYRLIDIGSRLSFNFIRIGGKYHADIEAASQEDLGIIYDICNNNLSWNRRPAYVQINDNLFIAASYSAFPHGESSENFGGHICLHFKNSKTHGTIVKDLEHQKSISKAYKQRDNIEKYL